MQKILKRIFIIIFFLMLFVPMALTRRGENIASDIDNRMLAELPKSINSGNFKEELDSYLSDRVGFRESLIRLYQSWDYRIFGRLTDFQLVHGSEGHLFSLADQTSYQRFPPEEDFREAFSGYISCLSDYAGSKGADFLYVAVPNKADVYGEYMNPGYNVSPGEERYYTLTGDLTDRGVDNIYLRDFFLENKGGELLYNKTMDVLHWNDRGCFLAAQEICRHLGSKYPDFHITDMEDFFTHEVHIGRLDDRIDVPVEDDIVKIDRTRDFPGEDSAEVFGDLVLDRHYMWHCANPDKPDSPRILVFGDSYFCAYPICRYLYDSASDLTVLHTLNLDNYQEIVDSIQPDIIILEVVDRAFGSTTVGPWTAEAMNEHTASFKAQ